MKRLIAVTILAALTVLAIGCGDDSPTGASGDPLKARQLPLEIQQDAFDLAAANTAFAVDLYAVLVAEQEKKGGGNLFLSPFSVSTAFAMCYGGARANTETQMAEVFKFPLDQTRLHPVFNALLVSLDTGADFGGYRLNIANRLWGQEDYDFVDAYLALTRDHYLAELETVNFSADPEAARTEINDWVADRTEDRIQDLMPPNSITDLTRLVLTNAIYFKGTWETLFDEDETADMPFFTDPQTSVDVPTMHREGEAQLAFFEGGTLLELPYQGADLSMVLILPETLGGFADLESRLTVENLNAWMSAVTVVEDAEVYLPRFEIESEFSLNETLKAMGMPDAFDPSLADFSGINTIERLFIQAAVHKAFVKVNEEGTEAAAATGISIGIESLPPGFYGNHPFLFLIRDNVTDSILFLGRVMDPSA